MRLEYINLINNIDLINNINLPKEHRDSRSFILSAFCLALIILFEFWKQWLKLEFLCEYFDLIHVSHRFRDALNEWTVTNVIPWNIRTLILYLHIQLLLINLCFSRHLNKLLMTCYCHLTVIIIFLLLLIYIVPWYLM